MCKALKQHAFLNQILQQCILCESRRNQHNRDELSRSGLSIWIGVPFECDPHNFSDILFLSPERDDIAPASPQHLRTTIFLFCKIIKSTTFVF